MKYLSALLFLYGFGLVVYAMVLSTYSNYPAATFDLVFGLWLIESKGKELNENR